MKNEFTRLIELARQHPPMITALRALVNSLDPGHWMTFVKLDQRQDDPGAVYVDLIRRFELVILTPQGTFASGRISTDGEGIPAAWMPYSEDEKYLMVIDVPALIAILPRLA